MLLSLPVAGYIGKLYFDQPGINHEEMISFYLEKLEENPEDCFSIEQIAGGYQALNQFDKAIYFFGKAIDVCTDNRENLFQLGICHYLMMERDVGIEYMDKAIEQARESGDIDEVRMYTEEKRQWLEYWPKVKELDWNRGKQAQHQTLP